MYMDYLERTVKLIKAAGLRKMGIGFAMFLCLCALVYTVKIPAEVYSSLVTALIAAMFMGNVAEHYSKKEPPKPEA